MGISTELDLVISGAKDGTCLLHTVRQGHYMHTLRPRQGHNCEIHQVAISNTGRLVVYSEDTTQRQRVRVVVKQFLFLVAKKTKNPRRYYLVCFVTLFLQLNVSVPPCIHLYTSNGLLLQDKELAECINAMVVVDKYLITGNTKGYLTFRNLFRCVCVYMYKLAGLGHVEQRGYLPSMAALLLFLFGMALYNSGV